MADLSCAWCYRATLTPDQLQRHYADVAREKGCEYICPDHLPEYDAMMDRLKPFMQQARPRSYSDVEFTIQDFTDG